MTYRDENKIADLHKFIEFKGKVLLDIRGEWEVARWEATNPGDAMPIIYTNKRGTLKPNPQAMKLFMDWLCRERT